MKTRKFAFVVLIAVLAVVMCGSAFAASKSGKSGKSKKAQSVPEYHQGDVKVIQGIIRNNLRNEEFDLNSPSSWNFVKWSAKAPKRVIGIDIEAPYPPEGDYSGAPDPDEYLVVYGNFDLRALPELVEFSLRENCGEVSQVDVSNCKNLEVLVCHGTGLIALDVSNNTKLKLLDCGDNRTLTRIDISKLPMLERLDCSYNKLTALDVSKNKRLKSLDCYRNNLTHLDVSYNLQLEHLDCRENPIKKLTKSKNKLKELYY